MLWNVSRFYSRLYANVQDRAGRNLKGLGFLLRRLKTDREFTASGYRWFFDHRIAGTYMRLVGGSFNEPETQSFLRFVLDRLSTPITFVDVGANIGEFIVSMAAHANVSKTIGFEPHPVCGDVLRRHVTLNGLKNVDLRFDVVSDGTPQPYAVDWNYAPTSGIQFGSAEAANVPTVRLDDELAAVRAPCILLIDVESAELDVLKGGASFIATARPLIVFEYHYLSRKRYSLDQVRAVIGPDYDIWRLRTDGMLDRELENTTNCVAVPRATEFASICSQRVKA